MSGFVHSCGYIVMQTVVCWLYTYLSISQHLASLLKGITSTLQQLLQLASLPASPNTTGRVLVNLCYLPPLSSSASAWKSETDSLRDRETLGKRLSWARVGLGSSWAGPLCVQPFSLYEKSLTPVSIVHPWPSDSQPQNRT